jgi:hypothetical protein
MLKIILIILVICGNIQISFAIAINIIKPVNSCSLMDTCLKDGINIKSPFKSDMESNCYCDKKCRIYQDCCENFKEESNQTVLEKIEFNCNLSRTIFEKDKKNNFIYSIGVCPNEYSDYITKIKCKKSNDVETDQQEDTFLKWPFYSNMTHYTYNNIYCAICNGEKMIDLHPWQAAFRCNKSVNIINSSQILEKIKKKCTFTKWMHSFMQFRQCRNNLIQTCLNRSDSLTENKCINGPYKIRYSPDGNLVFRNEYCAACNGIAEPTCKQLNITNKKLKSTATEITFSLFFDFNFFDGEYEVGFKRFQNDILKLKRVNCDNDSFFDPVR